MSPTTMQVPSESQTGNGYSTATVFYTVTIDNGRAFCTCRGFEFNHACKHIENAQLTLEQPQPREGVILTREDQERYELATRGETVFDRLAREQIGARLLGQGWRQVTESKEV
jgi:hypothetical protein